MNKPIKRLLRQLPYQEMRQLSTEIGDKVNVNPTELADVLSTLPDQNEVEDRDNRLLSGAFTRKKQITIQPWADGSFKISMPSVDGATVVDRDIRSGMSQLFDLLTVLEAME